MKILITQEYKENTEMADIEDRYKTYKSYPERKTKRAKPAHNNFTRNVSKKSRKEWGARMQFFRSL